LVNCPGGTASTEQDHATTGNGLATALFEGPNKTVGIGVVSYDGAVVSKLQGVDSANGVRFGGYRIAEGHYRLLVRHRDTGTQGTRRSKTGDGIGEVGWRDRHGYVDRVDSCRFKAGVVHRGRFAVLRRIA